MSRLSVSVMLRPGASGTAAEIGARARHAERLGLDGVFVGDHLLPAMPFPESTIVLATAAAATRRIRVGFGVMVLALRDPVWAAKQLATLQNVSGGRVVLGVGIGGVVHGTEAWRAVGVPYADRGRRTDAALALLPGLIRGDTVELPSGASVTLSPGAPPPPLWIGGGSPAALRRAARHGAGWFPSMVAPDSVAVGARRLAEEMDGLPRIAVGGAALLGGDAPAATIEAFVSDLVRGYGIPPDDAAAIPIAGTPSQAAERFAAYADAGATHLVLGAIGDDWERQWELIAEAAALLD